MDIKVVEKPDFIKAEKEALRVLDENFIQAPPIPVRDLLEFAGLGIIESEFEDGGISGVINLETKYLYINTNDSFERKRFTIAHEFGHWVLHKSQMELNKEIAIFYRKSIGIEENIWEQEANCFAANLLVPEHMLKEFIAENKDGLISDAKLAELFEVSRPVIGYRRKFLGI